MGFSKASKFFICFFIACIALGCIAIGLGFGALYAENRHVTDSEMLKEFKPALPSTLLDIHGEVITEFFDDQKRDMIPVDELPKELIYAIITREDKNFFQHRGFSFKGTTRAAIYILLNKVSSGGYVSGGSTITQQVAGANYADKHKPHSYSFECGVLVAAERNASSGHCRRDGFCWLIFVHRVLRPTPLYAII